MFVTVGSDGSLCDRRRVQLVDDDLPAIPHHHEAQMLPPDAAVALIGRVRASAERHASTVLEALTVDVPDVRGIALRVCPPLPATIEERIKDYRACNVADWVMYRLALASAAETRGWPIYWYDSKTVFESASQALHLKSLEKYFTDLRSAYGPPWNADHRLAMSAAIAALHDACPRARQQK